MRRRITDTTFGKMTVAYLLFGVIPLFLISLLFFSRFTDNIRETMIRNYAQINGYFARNVQDIMESADAAMAELYNYETDDGESLAAVLKNSNLTDGERSLEVDEALKEVMSKSKHIASTRFVDINGKIYSVYYNQEKTLRNDAQYYTQMGIIPQDEMRDLRVLRTTEESNICINSDDFIFVLVRNYMDTTSINRAYSTPLGTLFVDINVNVLENLVDKIGLEKGSLYICNPKEKHYAKSVDEAYHAIIAHDESYLEKIDKIMDKVEAIHYGNKNAALSRVLYFVAEIGTKLFQYQLIEGDYNEMQEKLQKDTESRKTFRALRECIRNYYQNLWILLDNNGKSKDKLMIEQVKDYIKAHYAEDMSIKELADVACVSQNYFSALFKKETGQNYKAYLTSIRMEEAIKLLRTTDLKTYEIGEKVGYNNVRRFVDAFKQIYNVSPMEYRKSLI